MQNLSNRLAEISCKLKFWKLFKK
uniref:Uncharacterized protein n=1 Tax=Rhizophora mucronata TaxID=61149 RepID=A0A2P2Q0Z2_RHIMU